MISTAYVECRHCHAAHESHSAVFEVGSWLFLNCPSCRCQSDVTMQLGPPAMVGTLVSV